jgi:hypothetical protein
MSGVVNFVNSAGLSKTICQYYFSLFLINMDFLDPKGFWRWCIILRITGVSGFAHGPVFWKVEDTTFPKLCLFSFSGEGEKTPTLLGPLERASDWGSF